MPIDYDKILSDTANFDSLQMYLKEINQIPLLTPEEELELGYRINAGDQQAVNELVVHNLKYVVPIAKSFAKFGIPLKDLINDGNIGLIEAANKFDINKGTYFVGYARYYIIQKIEQAITYNCRNIRIPYHTFEKIIKYHKGKAALTKKLGHIPNEDELADALNMDLEEVKKFEALSNDTLSLDYLISDDNPIEFGSFVSNGEYSRPLEEAYIKKSLPEEIWKLFEALEISPTDVDILVERFGLDGNGIRTYEEISNKYGRSRPWSMQRINKVLTRIRYSKYFRDNF